MAETIGAKSKRFSKAKPMKICLRCKVSRPLEDYYVNREWKDMLGKDAWCKECVSKIATKDEMREYFWENHREFTERIWDLARARAEKLASVNQTMQKMSGDKRDALMERLTCQQIPMVMGPLYKYVDPSKLSGATSYQEAKEKGEIIAEEVDPNLKMYSKEFNGYFKPAEIEYLENYYKGLEQDFTLSDTNLRDIAKKLAKASLQADKAQDDYMAGRCDFSVVKDSMTQFDLLSKSGNFAACKRQPGEGAGLSSWSETTLQLETTGHTCTRKIEWPKDDVDVIIEEFRHIVEAIGGD